MARVTADEYAEKWSRRLKASTEDIRKGIDKVDAAPGVKAARAQELMLRRLTDSITSGKWANQVGAVSLDSWKASAKGKGVERIARGVDDATPAQVAMAQKLLAAVDSAAAKARALPKGSIEDSINRMTTFVREMHKNPIKK